MLLGRGHAQSAKCLKCKPLYARSQTWKEWLAEREGPNIGRTYLPVCSIPGAA